MKVLIINICREPLHYYEFVKPIEDTMKLNAIDYVTKEASTLTSSDLTHATHIIISGTSLRDNDFLEELPLYVDLFNEKKPILGICGGMQIIGAVLGAGVKERKEIGMSEITFDKPFIHIEKNEAKKVWQLHNLYLDKDELPADIEICATSHNNVPQAIKHKTKPIFGVLFHPEVRNRDLLTEFVKI